MDKPDKKTRLLVFSPNGTQVTASDFLVRSWDIEYRFERYRVLRCTTLDGASVEFMLGYNWTVVVKTT